MSPELIAILAVGVALGGMILQGQRSLGQRLDKRMDGLDKRMDGLDKRMDRLDQRLDRLDRRMDGLDRRMDGLDARLRAVEAGMAEIKGQLMIVRDYISGRNMRRDEPPAAAAE